MARQTDDIRLSAIAWDILVAFLTLIGDLVILLFYKLLFLSKKIFGLLGSSLILSTVYLFSFLKRLQNFLKFQISLLIPRLSNILKQFRYTKTKSYQRLTNRLQTSTRIAKDVARHDIKLPTVFYTPLKLPRFHRPRLRIPRPSSLMVGFSVGSLLTMTFVFAPYYLYVFVKYLPHPSLLSQRVIPVTTQIFDRHGTLLYEIHGDEDRKPIQLAKVPDNIKHATIAIEDKEFYQHPGFSLTGIARAARENVVNHQVQGGSTITQQLIKNSLLTSEVSYWRKLREVFLAFWAEKIYTKDEILEMYLNQVPYGGTAWGIEAAAETYFGKQVGELNLAESAYLAGLPAAPTYYSPYGAHPELAKKRQEEVLRRMVEDGYISKTDSDTAKQQLLNIKPSSVPIKAPHFVMYVRDVLNSQFGTRQTDQGGLRVTTSLDLTLQEKVQSIVSDEISKLTSLRVGNGAAVVTDPKTGEILAMVGSKDYFNANADGNVNVALSQRQPGSSIKVVTYATALEKGMTPASIIDDTPVSYPLVGQPAYAPVNYDGRFHGKVTMRLALANSYNVPAVKTLNQVGLASMIDTGKNMGIDTWTDTSRFGLSLTLGGGEVTLLDMTEVYGTLANLGERVDANPILKVTDYSGKVYYEKSVTKNRALSSETAFILSDIMADNAARTPAFGPNSSLNISGKTVSVKTGTTNEKRDNWTLGYTPSYVVGVWVGNNDNTPMDPVLTSGITGASTIWNRIMVELLKDKGDEKFSPPANLVKLPCFGKSEYFVKGTEPKGGCRAPSPAPSPSSSTR